MNDEMAEEIGRINELIDERRYGKYRACVVDNKDPEKRGRLRLLIPSVLGDTDTGWALPCFPFGGGKSYGWFAVPNVDAWVWAEFEEGDIARPIWTGTFWDRDEDVPEDAAKEEPTTRIFQTPSGHIMQFDDKKDEESFRLFHPREAEISIDKNGTLVLKDASGANITLDAEGKKIIIEDANNNQLIMDSSGACLVDANGNKIEMAAAGVTVKGQQIVLKGTQVMLGGEGGEFLIKGTSFLTFFNTHTHPTAAPGSPTAPPMVPMTPAMLSTKVTTT